tara:strand:+ start:1454 stop:1915 length:462 start_codon:yes stop_codon:yes gene_type:complete
MDDEPRESVRKSYQEYVSEKTAINIEKGLFNRSIEDADVLNISSEWENPVFVHLYLTLHCEILNYLQIEEIRDKIHKKEILSKNVANLKPYDICPANWKPEVFEEGDEVAEGIFQCKNCGSRKTTYYSVQTRSADEPMTNFITCVECKNRWKM